MILDEEVLEHAGVKGMKWGQRRARDKAKIIGAGVAGYEVTNLATGLLRAKVGVGPGPLVSMGLSVGAATLAVQATKGILNKHGNVKVLKKKPATN